MDNQEHLKEVAAWELARNPAAARIDWRFYHGGRPHQAEASLPTDTTLLKY